MSSSPFPDLAVFQTHRPALMALAYRMLGELSRAEDVVQNAWLRWSERATEAETPRSYLLTTVTRLCLDELGSARQRRESVELPRADRLPEPLDVTDTELARLETREDVSYAFLVVLQRLTPAERAVFLLHDVFDLEHREIGARLGRSEAACRQLLGRARRHVADEQRAIVASADEHRRLVDAFLGALTTGDMSALSSLLAEDAELVIDPGAATHYGRIQALGKPVRGRDRIMAIVRGFIAQPETARVAFVPRTLNGAPAAVTVTDNRITSALIVAGAGDAIHRLYIQYDPQRLGRLGKPA